MASPRSSVQERAPGDLGLRRGLVHQQARMASGGEGHVREAGPRHSERRRESPRQNGCGRPRGSADTGRQRGHGAPRDASVGTGRPTRADQPGGSSQRSAISAISEWIPRSAKPVAVPTT